MHKQSLFSLFPFIMITACASNQPIIDMKTTVQNKNIIVLPVANPVKLIETTKGQAVGNMVISSVVGSVLSGGANISAGTPPPYNSGMNSNFATELNRALPSNYVVKSGSGVDLALAKSLSEALPHDYDPAISTNLFVSITANYWNLAYISLFSSDYVLKYYFLIDLKEKTGEKYKEIKGYGCMGEVVTKHTYDDWVANDYSLVNAAANDVVKKCTDQYLAFTNGKQ